MAFELATYGLIVGLLYVTFKKQNLLTIYISLISAMIAGRLVWGMMQAILLGSTGTPFTFRLFLAGALLQAVPGILLQLILIPSVIFTLHKTHLLPFRKGTYQQEK